MKIRFEFEKLIVYRKAIEFTNKIYRISNDFPKFEQYGLANQLKRSASSIALNIAEGYGRYYKKVKKQFYNIAYSSVKECVSILTIAFYQKYIKKFEYEELFKECYELSRMSSGLIKAGEKRKQ